MKNKINKDIVLLLFLFIFGSLVLSQYTFLNIFFSIYFSFLLFGIELAFIKFNKKIKKGFLILFTIINLVVISFSCLVLAAPKGTCAMEISECTHGSELKFRIDNLLKKDAYKINLDWEEKDFLFGVYKNKEKQKRVERI